MRAVRARCRDRRRRLRVGAGRARGRLARRRRRRSASRTRSRGSPTSCSASVVRSVFVAFDEQPALLRGQEGRDDRQPGAPRAACAKLLAGRRARRADRRPCHVLVCGGSQGAIAVNELASRGADRCSRTTLPVAIVASDRRQGPRRDRARAIATPASRPTAARSSRTWPPPTRAPISSSARAGATTVAELAIAGKPAMLIPYPVRRRQSPGAQRARDGRARRGADVSPGRAHRRTSSPMRCDRCFADPAARATMAAAMKALGPAGRGCDGRVVVHGAAVAPHSVGDPANKRAI